MEQNNFLPVAMNSCKDYSEAQLTEILTKQFAALGIDRLTLAGKRIVIKPNLVMNKKPELAATTHPNVVAAAANVLHSLGAENLTMAESSGGPYTESTMRLHYNGCGMTPVAEEKNIALNYDPSAKTMNFSDGAACRSFHVINPIADADIIVNICKLKTHSLTKMSCGVKNFYGVIPGTEKVEMHARFSRLDVFAEMICDLAQMLDREKMLITICDGVCGMEGNGPTGGTPRDYGVLLTSLSPFCLDLLAEYLLDFAGTVQTVTAAKQRGLCPQSVSELTVLGEIPKDLQISDVVQPDTSRWNILRELPDLFGGRLARFLEPRPQINRELCIGCGVCANCCPKKTIVVKSNGKKKVAQIIDKNCIRCYCCQEMCPKNAVRIKKNLLLKIVH